MQERLYIELFASVSNKGFSLDELVIKVKELFEREGMAGVIGLILRLVDERISIDLARGLEVEWWQKCCGDAKLEQGDRNSRRFRSSAGEIKILWWRLRCRRCGKSFVPLREFLQLKRYQSKTKELEKMVTEVISEQSYRRSSQHLRMIGEIPVPKSTAHRWVMRSECDELDLNVEQLDVLIADGTGFKRRVVNLPGESGRGDLKAVIGINNDGKVVPMGCWTNSSWQEVGQDLKNQIRGEEPVAKILISDGELGLSQGLADLANEEQRCQWHQVHELPRHLWEDKAPRPEKKKIQSRVAGILGIELPKEDYAPVTESDKKKIQDRTTEAEKKLDTLISELIRKGYHSAAVHISRAKNKLFTYVRFWLEHGLVSPRVSSMLERMMREIGRRLKRMAFGWSDLGAAKIARIILKRITSNNAWNKYWQEQLRITGNVIMIYRGTRTI